MTNNIPQILFIAAVCVMVVGLLRLNFLLDSTDPFGPTRRNSKKYINLGPFRKRSCLEWLLGKPSVLKVLANLPDELEELDMNYCDEVVEITSLPPKLRIIKAKFCKNLRRVCDLPDTVEVADFWCSESLEALPKLSQNLRWLYAPSIAATALPEKLPSGLEELDMRCCANLATGPGSYPATMRWINFYGTPLAGKVTAQLPHPLSTEDLNSSGYTGYRANRFGLYYG